MMKLFNDWNLQPQYLTAWLQAFAALVALFISGFAVWRTEGAARRRDRLALRGVAVAIYPEIEMLKISTQNVRDGMTLAKERDGHLVGQSVGASLQLITHIDVPPMLERNTDRLCILGDGAGTSCLQLVRLLLQYNATAERLLSRVMMLSAEQWVKEADQLEGHLALLDNVIEKCEREVRPLHDAVKT